MRMAPKLGAKVNRGKDGGGVNPDVVENVGMEGSHEVERIGFEGGNLWDIAKGVPIDKFFLGNPKFLSVVVDDVVLVGVSVFDKGTGGGRKEVWE